MKKLESSRDGIANTLRGQADGPDLPICVAAIEGLGELGGRSAVVHIEELMDAYHDKNDDDCLATWAALLRAYGRAARNLD